MVVPRKLGLYAVTSYIFDDFKRHPWEVAGGASFYPYGKPAVAAEPARDPHREVAGQLELRLLHRRPDRHHDLARHGHPALTNRGVRGTKPRCTVRRCLDGIVAVRRTGCIRVGLALVVAADERRGRALPQRRHLPNSKPADPVRSTRVAEQKKRIDAQQATIEEQKAPDRRAEAVVADSQSVRIETLAGAARRSWKRSSAT